MEYHRLVDDKHIEVLAGDLKKGVWQFSEAGEISTEGADSVELEKNTKSLEVRLKRQVGRMDTMSELPVGNIVSLGLATLYGPMGGLASSALGMVLGKSDFLCIGCQLVDGRKFIAWMSKSVLERWEKTCNLQAVEKVSEKKSTFPFPFDFF